MRMTHTKHRGFTLIETLVALVVLSVGLMGIAALYSQSLGAGRTANFRTQAVTLAADLADRIRVNRLAGNAYAGLPADNNCDADGGAVPGDCTPGQLAAHDLLRWQAAVAQTLPNGVGAVAFNPITLPPTYTISVTWTEVNQGNLTYTMNIQVPPLF